EHYITHTHTHTHTLTAWNELEAELISLKFNLCARIMKNQQRASRKMTHSASAQNSDSFSPANSDRIGGEMSRYLFSKE
ncbi:hypothetical protein LSH36_102g05007, partial [Paralvinella palmiformis]